MEKGLKLKVRKFRGLIFTFAEVTEEKLVGGFFIPHHILNRVKKVWDFNWNRHCADKLWRSAVK